MVILSEAKDLRSEESPSRRAGIEILRYAQDDVLRC